jgi:gluconokinase
VRTACPSVRFLFLDGDRAVIEARMAQRRDHYMPTSLLESQLRTLERPAPDETDVMRVNIDHPLDTLVQQACAALRHADASAELHPKEPST